MKNAKGLVIVSSGTIITTEHEIYSPEHMDWIQECGCNGGFQVVEVPSSDGKTSYLITLPPWDRTADEIVCECPGYLFRGRCRHQREALSLVCNWSELDGQAQTVEQQRSQLCPECGGSTRIVVIGEE